MDSVFFIIDYYNSQPKRKGEYYSNTNEVYNILGENYRYISIYSVYIYIYYIRKEMDILIRRKEIIA